MAISSELRGLLFVLPQVDWQLLAVGGALTSGGTKAIETPLTDLSSDKGGGTQQVFGVSEEAVFGRVEPGTRTCWIGGIENALMEPRAGSTESSEQGSAGGGGMVIGLGTSQSRDPRALAGVPNFGTSIVPGSRLFWSVRLIVGDRIENCIPSSSVIDFLCSATGSDGFRCSDSGFMAGISLRDFAGDLILGGTLRVVVFRASNNPVSCFGASGGGTCRKVGIFRSESPSCDPKIKDGCFGDPSASRGGMDIFGC
jgi:hypothetical protein